MLIKKLFYAKNWHYGRAYFIDIYFYFNGYNINSLIFTINLTHFQRHIFYFLILILK